MIRLSVNEVTTYRWSFEEDVRSYLDARIDGISVWRQKLSDFGESKGVELLGELGLPVSSLVWAGGFTGSDGRSFRESVEDAFDAIQTAAELSAPTLLVYSGARAGHTKNHARRLFQSALEEVLPAAEEAGVCLAVEPMQSSCATEWTCLRGLEEVLALIQEVDHRCLKLAFDAYHLGRDPEIVDRLDELVPMTAIVQLGDCRRPPDSEQNRCPLGEGTIPLGRIVQGFLTAGYDGFFDVELMGEDLEGMEYAQLLQRSRQTFDQWIGS